MPGIEPGASYMQSMRSTTELHPLMRDTGKVNYTFPAENMNENMIEKRKALVKMQKYKIKWTEESERLNVLHCTAENLKGQMYCSALLKNEAGL